MATVTNDGTAVARDSRYGYVAILFWTRQHEAACAQVRDGAWKVAMLEDGRTLFRG